MQKTFQSYLITEDAKEQAHNIASNIKKVGAKRIERDLDKLGAAKGVDHFIRTVLQSPQFRSFKDVEQRIKQQKNEETINEGVWGAIKWVGKKFILWPLKFLLNNVIMPVFGSVFQAEEVMDKIELAGYLYLIFLLPGVIAMSPGVTWTALLASPLFQGPLLAWIITILAHKLVKLSGAIPEPELAMA